MEEKYEFDFDEILDEFRNGKKLTGKDELLAPLIKQLTEAALEAEIESHIADDVLLGKKNRRNGVNKKAIKGTVTVRLSWKRQEIVTVPLNYRS